MYYILAEHSLFFDQVVAAFGLLGDYLMFELTGLFYVDISYDVIPAPYNNTLFLNDKDLYNLMKMHLPLL